MGSSAKPGLIIFICGILGVLLAAIEQIAFDNSYVLHLYLEAAQVPGLQILTILVCLLAGGALAAISS